MEPLVRFDRVAPVHGDAGDGRARGTLAPEQGRLLNAPPCPPICPHTSRAEVPGPPISFAFLSSEPGFSPATRKSIFRLRPAATAPPCRRTISWAFALGVWRGPGGAA